MPLIYRVEISTMRNPIREEAPSSSATRERVLREEAAEAADCLIRIPMEGQVESLNAAMAAGILMYEAARQRRTGEVTGGILWSLQWGR